MKTRENLQIKNLKHFPSMEWGENGGTSCDIYFGKTLVAQYFNDGNGGEPMITMLQYSYQWLKDKMKCFLMRWGIYQKALEKYDEDIVENCIFEEFIGWWENFADLQKSLNKIIKEQDKNDTTKVIQVVAVDDFKTYQKFYKLSFFSPFALSEQESISIGERFENELVERKQVKKQSIIFARAFSKENYKIV